MPKKIGVDMLSKRDKAIISLISNDIPLVREPFKKLALELGIEKRVLLERIKSYKENGLMRKFSAVINHRKIGFRYNAMAVWNIPDSIVKAGSLMASFPEVSHCYERKRAPYWKYNLYSMIHGKTKEKCLSVVRDIAKKTYCKDYKILFSSHEYKKEAAKYFKGTVAKYLQLRHCEGAKKRPKQSHKPEGGGLASDSQSQKRDCRAPSGLAMTISQQSLKG